MKKIFLSLVVLLFVHNHLFAQSAASFIAGVPEILLSGETDLKKDNDVNKIPVSPSVARNLLYELEGEHYVIGKITLSRSTAVVYYSKPAGGVPFGKVSVVTLTSGGKKISTEAIGVFSDFSGMRFHMTMIASAQTKGNISITSKVMALKENGEINDFMSNTSTFLISAKGKISKL